MSPASGWTRRIARANLIAQVGIVVTGGLVRLTGSGLGCPSWPQCVPGSYTPVARQAQGYHKYIEFGNRTLTSVVSLTALAVLVSAVVLVRRRAASRRWLALASVPLLLVAVQAVLGGITVLLGLHPATVAAHFLVSMVLIAVSTVLVLSLGPDPAGGGSGERPGEQPGRAVPVARRELGWLATAVVVVAGVILVLGTVVTGAGPHSGDATAPARFAVDPRTVSWLHADAVWLFVGLVAALLAAARLTDAPPRLQRAVLALMVVTLAQGGIGYVQYATGLPALVVALHMLGACLLVIAVTAVAVAVRSARGRTGRLLSPGTAPSDT